MIRNVVVLGAGSAGLIAALTLRRQIPDLAVRIVRSSEIGVIGVGEGTTQSFPQFLVNQLGFSPEQVLRELQPTWKLGIRFLWGPRPHFFYTFSNQFNYRWQDLPRNNGFYCDTDVDNLDIWSALMSQGKAFARQPNGAPQFAQHRHVGFHFENQKLVSYLEHQAKAAGVVFAEGTVRDARLGQTGIEALILENGEELRADLYVDASGFRAELLGRALSEPFVSFADTIFCDRAVIGGWARTDEPILPYTTVETMDAGWCWQIEHENWINRGYVYSSPFISDEAACAEFLRTNPKIATTPRVVKFRAGRYKRMWVQNVVGIGNASGFVEPLEATALATIITQSTGLAAVLIDSFRDPSPSMKSLYNRFIGETWDEIRDFLGLHYAFNKRRDTPFWRHCQTETPLNGAQEIVEFFRENGPSAVHQTAVLRQMNSFGMEGYLAMLVGQQVPYRKVQEPSNGEFEAWRRHCAQNAAAASAGMTVRETLDLIRRNDVSAAS